MPKKYTIVWQKWQDDLFDDDALDTEENNEIDDSDNTDEDDVEDHKPEPLFSKKKSLIITPIGLLPYNEATACNKSFNLWIGHTNFTINKTISDIIECCDGVETLDIFTRYRFRIAVGQVFSDSSVMRDINNQLYNYLYESN